MENEVIKNLDISLELNEIQGCDAIIDRIDSINSIVVLQPSIKEDAIPYFKIFNNFVVHDAIKCARISIVEPRYIYCYDNYKDTWILNEYEIKELINFLSSQMRYTNCKQTNWEYLVMKYNDILHFEDIKGFETNINMPDYTLLK